MKNISEKFNNFFEIDKRKSNVKTEIFAGITTFLAMAYILVVNPNNILLNGTSDPRFSSVFIATAIGAFIGTILMALMAKMPLAQAPGMGLNAIVGTVIGGAMGYSYSYGNAMLLIFISGIIFLILSFIPGGTNRETGTVISLREKIFDGIPKPIINSISVGVGLFIAFIGLQNAHIITGDKYTLVKLVDFNNPDFWVPGGDACMALVALTGLIIIGILSHYKVNGAIIWGIVLSTIIAIPLGVADLNIILGKVSGINWNFKENIVNYFNFSSGSSVFLSLLKDGFSFPAGSLMTSIMLIISFSLIDVFDTMGTVVGCCKNANLVDKNGKPLNYTDIMYADSLAAIFGSLLGTSTVSIFVESSAGVSAGGKTGLTALTTALLFLIAIVLLPLFAFIPSAAAASALIYVGVLMIANIKFVDFKKIKNAIPAFMTIMIMLLSYSITNGIGMGIITFTVLDLGIYFIDLFRFKLGKSKKKPVTEVNTITIIVVVLFLIYFLAPIVH